MNQMVNQNDSISCYASRRNSNTSAANSEPQEVAPHLVKYVSLFFFLIAQAHFKTTEN